MSDSVVATGGREMLLSCQQLHKTYFRGTEVPVLRGVNFGVQRGEFVSIIGSSGSGKSTLLHLLGLLDAPTSGSVHYDGKRVDDQPRRYADRFRNEVVGFVFQFYHLLPELNALENVMLPEMIRLSPWRFWGKRRRVRQHAKELLARVGLGHRLNHKPRHMSGGELQRAAIARALLARPQILLADEPTGNLDADTGAEIVSLLADIRRELDLTIVMVTHDVELAQEADRVMRLTQGVLEDAVVAPLQPFA